MLQDVLIRDAPCLEALVRDEIAKWPSAPASRSPSINSVVRGLFILLSGADRKQLRRRIGCARR